LQADFYRGTCMYGFMPHNGCICVLSPSGRLLLATHKLFEYIIDSRWL
jgi:hypothetical protein